MSEEKISKDIIIIALVAVLGALPPMLDATIINIAINDLAKTFSATLATTQWVVTGYTLALGIAVPFSGWLIQKFDGKKIFMSALGVFLLSSLLSGLSWNIPSLIAFRLLQGFASGLMIPTLTTLLVQLAGGDHIGRLMSIVGIPIVLGPILGPVIGGLILQYLNWNWLFFVNLPVGAIALCLIQWKLPAFEASNKYAKLDWLGVLLLAVVSGFCIYGIIEVGRADGLMTGILAIITGVLAAVAYINYAWRMRGQALIPLALFQSRNFSAAFVSLFLAGFATNGPMLLLPMFFQNVRSLDVITSALWLIPQGVGMLVARPLIGQMTDKIGARWVVLPSIVLTILGTLPFIFFDNGTEAWMIWTVLAVRGMGVGGFTIPVMSDSYVGLQKPQVPQASVVTRIVQNIGAAFGSALLATVVANSFTGNAHSLSNTIVAYHMSFIVSLIFMVISILPALFLTNKLRRSVSEGRINLYQYYQYLSRRNKRQFHPEKSDKLATIRRKPA
ncbi:MDR family MFS transporter [Ktedonospora formicarum]|uniref:MFS transporter n=1 Tax=Ktedonospora formicarum TaxID=2778364 RepID=A0A8J3I634_9CHLR|nr:MDR family MFS transporter [Ktedonospora formicarum]GHO46054.1 MFS transporter [Ktedonospora formicarum]